MVVVALGLFTPVLIEFRLYWFYLILRISPRKIYKVNDYPIEQV